MTLARYEVFSTVVELGSITKAAEALNLTQPSISYSIANLEAELGFSLLTRNRSGISLTTDGERILKYVRTILLWNEKMKQEAASIKNIATGVVKIAAFNSVCIHWLPEIVKAFNQKYPLIEVRILQGSLEYIEQSITTGAVDFGFMILPTLTSLETIPLKQDKLLCILPKNHPLSNQEKVHIRQLEKELFIISRAGDRDVKRLVQEAGITLNTKFEIADDDSIMAFVENNLGISILPELVIQNYRSKISAHSFEQEQYRSICLAANSLQTLSPASQKFIECITQFLDTKYKV